MELDAATMGDLLARYGYLVVFVAALAEAIPLVGFLVPGQGFVIFAGALSATGRLDPFLLVALVAVAGVLGDAGTFYLGRHYGRGFLERFGPRVGIRERHLARSDALFQKYGPFALVIARFSFLTRAAGPLLAGISRMRQRVFWPINVLGALAMSIAYIALGYSVGLSFLLLQKSLGRILAITLLLALGVYAFYRLLRKLAPQLSRADLGLALLAAGGIVGLGVLAERVDLLGPANVVDRAQAPILALLGPLRPSFALLDLLLAPAIVGLVVAVGLVLLALRKRPAEAVLLAAAVGGALVLASVLALGLPGGLPDARTASAAAALGVAAYLAAAVGRWTGAAVAVAGGLAAVVLLLARIAGGGTLSSAVAGVLLAVGWLGICLLVVEYWVKSGASGPPRI